MKKHNLLSTLVLVVAGSACSDGEFNKNGPRTDPSTLAGEAESTTSAATSTKPIVVMVDGTVLSEAAVPTGVLTPPAPKPTLRLIAAATHIRGNGSSFQLNHELSTDNSQTEVRYILEGPEGKPTGSISSTGVYTSPLAVDAEYSVTINAIWLKDESVRASSKITLVPTGQMFTACADRSLLFPIYADVYTVPVATTTQIPDFDLIPNNKFTRVCMDSFNIPNGSTAPGFPGRSTQIEWFAMWNRTVLYIPIAGVYRFRLGSDDGARLGIDGQGVINHDGIHPFSYLEGSKQLAVGEHPLVVRYLQGETGIGLELQWMPPGSTVFTIIPTSAFR